MTLTVTPAHDQRISTVAGRVAPVAASYRWECDTQVPHAWAVRTSVPWLVVEGPATGTFQTGRIAMLRFRVEPSAAADMPIGLHQADVTFLDTSASRTVATRRVTLALHHDEPKPGYREFLPSADSRIVYVSSSEGNDANDGLSPRRAKSTIAAGKQLMREGRPDWLLLRRGDVFTGGVGNWGTQGRDEKEVQLLSSYGPASERPLLQCRGAGISMHGGGSTPPTRNFVAVVGLHFQGNQGTPEASDSTGISVLTPSSRLWFEDCLVERFHVGMVLQGVGGRHSAAAVIRCLFLDNFTFGTAHAQGFYTSETDGLRIEECVFDRNGWQPELTEARGTIFRHGVYVQTSCTGVWLRDNIVANSASHGVQLRSGGVAEGNVFLRNSISLLFAGGDLPVPGGTPVRIQNNVILDGKDISPTLPRGWGMSMTSLTSGIVSDNVIANLTQANSPMAIAIDGGDGSIGVRNVTLMRNIVSDWGGSVSFSGSANAYSGVVMTANEFHDAVSTNSLLRHSQVPVGVRSSDNTFHSSALDPRRWFGVGPNLVPLATWAPYVADTTSTARQVPRPHRAVSAADYHGRILGRAPTHEGYMAEVRRQSRSNWRDEYSAASFRHYVHLALAR